MITAMSPVKIHLRLALLVTSITLWFILLVSQTAGVSQHPIVIIVSFDGFRFDFLDKTRTPHFDALIATGVKAKWIKPRFATKTFPNHHSIATGLYEESHGIVANSFFDPALNEVFKKGDSSAEWWDTGAIPIYTWNQMQGGGRYSGGIMWPGTNAWIKNQLPRFVQKFDSKLKWGLRVDLAIQWLTDPATPVNCLMMYFEQPDDAEHHHGPNSPEVVKQIQRADSIVGYLVDRLKKFNLFHQVNLIITSDHGMAEVPKSHTIHMNRFSNIQTYRAFGESPVWNILPNPGHEQQVYNSLNNEAHRSGHFKVYHKRDIPDRWFYKNNNRIMPIVVVAKTHWDIYPNHARKPNNMFTGSHGYDNAAPQMRAFFVAHGPDFKSGFVSKPFKNIDIMPLASCLLGLQPPPNNGSLRDVASLLNQPWKCNQMPVAGDSSSLLDEEEIYLRNQSRNSTL